MLPAGRKSPGPVISVLKSVIDNAPPPIEVGGADKGPVDGGGGEDASLPVSLSPGPDDVSRQDLLPSPPKFVLAVDLNDVIREFGVVAIGGEDEFGDLSNIFFLEEG